MNLAFVALFATLATSASSFAAANPLDLTSVYKSVSCISVDNRKVTYDGTTRKVSLESPSAAAQVYNLIHFKKTTSGAELLAQSPSSGQHLLAFIDMPDGKTVVQVDGTSFYARCKVTKL